MNVGNGYQFMWGGEQRPTREFIHMETAYAWAGRSMCSQKNRKVGAVITSYDMRRILSFGYNGPGRDLPDNFCQTWRDSHEQKPIPNIILPAGFESSVNSKCPCLHAEDNAIAFVDSTVPDKRLFVTMQPCLMCAQRIMNANIRHVYFHQNYRDVNGLDLMRQARIAVYRFSDTGRFSKVT